MSEKEAAVATDGDSNGEPKTRPRSLRGRLKILGQLIASIAGILAFVSQNFEGDTFPLLIVAAIAMVLGISLNLYSNLLRERERDAEIEFKEAQIEKKERSISEEESILDMLKRQVSLAVNREEVSMLRAEGRSNSLFAVGRAFLIASILGPVAAAGLYLWIEPINPEVISSLKELAEIAGQDAINNLSIETRKDWRILLAGISFGLLFLAAARALLGQQAKEAETYFRLANRINYFERLNSVLTIKARFPATEVDDEGARLIDLVVENLLSDASNENEGPNKDSTNREAISFLPGELIELLKSAKDIK